MSSEWVTCELGNVVTFQRGYDLPQRDRRSGGVPIVTSSGIADSHSEARVRGPGVVTGRYGTIGQVFLVEEDFWPLNTTLFVKDFHGNDPRFVSYLVRTIDFHTHSGKSGVPGVNRNDLHLLEVRLPPPPEQRAIADALSDVDALLGALDRLIAKKRDLKQAVMQQLLTGQTRLPGFSGNWEPSTVGREFSIELGKMLDADRNVGVAKPYLGNKAVQWGRFELDDLATVRMTPDDLERYRLKRGDLLVCEGGEVGRAAIWDGSMGECYYQKALHRLRPTRSFSSAFMLAQLRFWTSTGALADYVTQTSIAHLTREKFALVPLLAPSPSEQMAIALVISDMDAELTALEARRDKTRLLKLGMMQELLTGRTRLI